LFIDTETSGIPKNWDAPYSDKDSWPYSVQIAWIVYTKDGKEVKAVNYYIRDNQFDISPDSVKIHGITSDFLDQHGVTREVVLEQLTEDLNTYTPLVIAHSMQLDYHMIGACYYRIGKKNPLADLPLFCTMRASSGFLLRNNQNYLRLGELYERLFGDSLEEEHDALVDAQATARCFFELLNKGDITDEIIEKQKSVTLGKATSNSKTGCSLAVVFILFFSLLFIYWV
jgi:DNA polymerase III subunit epsilon